MERPTFDHYYDYFEPKMEDIQVHNDFNKLMDWLSDKPGVVLTLSDIARVISDEEPNRDSMGRAMGAAAVMTTWPVQLADPAFQIRDAAGALHEVGLVDDDTMSGRKPYVIEFTGEVVEDFASNTYASFKVRDFEPRLRHSVPVTVYPKL